MSNVLSEEKKQQVIALGRLGWSLRRIEAAVQHSAGDRRGISEAPPASPCGHRAVGDGVRPAKPANEVITDSGAGIGADNGPRPQPLIAVTRPAPASRISELIELGLSRGRNAMAIWQDLVDSHGFAAGYQSVQRFVGKLRRQLRRKHVR